ncbi:MAG: helix-turn-helix domain-containing protein [Solobacterium sp.]|nr:helix-turn-helix domain-containing protein [Solobacterium sp.]
MKLSDRILELRRQKGISQEELADKLGVSRQAVSKWESEQSTPDIDKIILMSEYFGTTTDYLLKGIEPAARSTEKKAGNALSVMAPYMVWIGLITSCVLWYENQNGYAIMNGFIWMIGGYAVIRIAVLNGLADEGAMNRFLLVSFPAISFFIGSLIYTVTVYGIPAPYPMPGAPVYRLFIFAALWILVNAAAVTYLKKDRK